MSATFGAGSAPASPSGSVVNEWSDESSHQIKTYRDQTGTTIAAAQVPMTERKVSVSGIGTASFSLAANTSVTAGTLTLISLSQDDSNDDFPKFKAEYQAWS
jgi:hypothetical protein